jgi:hypothetical protein
MSCHTNNDGKELQLWGGLVAFVLGAVVLLEMFDVIPETTWDYLWPSVLVVLGLKLMMMGGKSGDCGHGMKEDCCAMEAPKKAAPKKKKAPAKKKKAKK